MAPPHHFVIPERTNRKKILEVIKKIIELLTLENEDRSHFINPGKEEMEEEEDGEMVALGRIEVHEELCKAAMMEDQPTERCPRPFYSWVSTQEGQVIPDHAQGGHFKEETRKEENRGTLELGCLEGRKAAMMENQPMDGSWKRSPLYSWDATEEGHVIPHHAQDGNPNIPRGERDAAGEDRGGAPGASEGLSDLMVESRITCNLHSQDSMRKVQLTQEQEGNPNPQHERDANKEEKSGTSEAGPQDRGSDIIVTSPAYIHPPSSVALTQEGQELHHQEGIPSEAAVKWEEEVLEVTVQEEGHHIPHAHQVEDPINVKPPEEKEKTSVRCDQRPIKRAGMTVIIRKEEKGTSAMGGQQSAEKVGVKVIFKGGERETSLRSGQQSVANAGMKVIFRDRDKGLFVRDGQQSTEKAGGKVIKEEGRGTSVSGGQQSTENAGMPVTVKEEKSPTEASMVFQHEKTTKKHPTLPPGDRTQHGVAPQVSPGPLPVMPKMLLVLQFSNNDTDSKQKKPCRRIAQHVHLNAGGKRADGTYSCPKCGEGFKTNFGLLAHWKVHPEEPASLCTECGKSFANRKNLLQHTLNAHPDQYPCSDCGKSFPRELQLIKHRRSHPVCKVFKHNQSPNTFMKLGGITQESLKEIPIIAVLQPGPEQSSTPRPFTNCSNVLLHLGGTKISADLLNPEGSFPNRLVTNASDMLLHPEDAKISPILSSPEGSSPNRPATNAPNILLHPGGAKISPIICNPEQSSPIPVINTPNIILLPGLAEQSVDLSSPEQSSLNRPATNASITLLPPAPETDLSNPQQPSLVRYLENQSLVCLELLEKSRVLSNIEQSPTKKVAHSGLHSTSSSTDPSCPEKCSSKNSAGVQENEEHSCFECGKRFPTEHSLHEHHKVHREERPFRCSECGKSFTRKENLVKHQSSHSQDRSLPHLGCGQCLALNSNLAEHRKNHAEHGHNVEKTSQEHLTSSPDDEVEVEITLDDPEEDSDTNICPRQHGVEKDPPNPKESFLDNLNTYSDRDRGDDKFKCSDCWQSFPSLYSLLSHRRVHTSDRPFLCYLCGKGLTRKSNLKQHLLLHSRKKTLPCLECGKCFFWKSELEEHQMTHMGHGPDGTKTPKSQSEGISYTQEAPPDVSSPGDRGSKTFPCSECGKSFSSAYSLHSHKSVHARKRKYPFCECDSTQKDHKTTQHE